MFFLIRCVFWLTVVYSTIFAPNQSPTTPNRQVEAALSVEAARHVEAVQQAAAVPAPADDSAEKLGRKMQNWVTAELQRLWGKATGGCSTSPADCVALAARLSDFARRHATLASAVENDLGASARSDRTEVASIEAPLVPAKVPLPPLRPQRVRFLEPPARSGFVHVKHPSTPRAEKRPGRS